MEPANSVRVLWCSDQQAAASDVRFLLEQAGFAAWPYPARGPAPDNLGGLGLIILEVGSDAPATLDLCRRLRACLGEAFVPILFITGDHSPAARLAGFQSGADACLLRPFEAGELLAQTRALLRFKELHTRLTDQSAELHRTNQRLNEAYQQINQELELARRVQMSFLPQTLPEVPQVGLAVHYRPCGRVGGDFYDVFRLDENHVGMYVADAMGHGIPASLLTIFLKKGVRPKEIFGKQYRLVPPGEVLQRLNRDLVEQAMAEVPFITMVYALFNFRDGTLQFARAGHPHPLYIPRQGEPELWQVHGTLLGVFETEFVPQTRQLRPGDKVLLYTDGLESNGTDNTPPPPGRLLSLVARHRGLPITDLVDRLAQDLLGPGRPADDWTLLGLEMRG